MEARLPIGAQWLHKGVATAADPNNTLAILVRRDGETLHALLQRLDQAIATAYNDGGLMDEWNSSGT